ncbi:MAG: aminoacyl-tRNA hydrolase, partial [Acidimicrobiales bacterium]
MAVDLLVVGLGNPGAEYERTRNNCGADTVALLARRHGGVLKRDRAHALTCEVALGPGARRMALAFPQTFYNDSGLAVAALLRRHHLNWVELVVVHDELDLE